MDSSVALPVTSLTQCGEPSRLLPILLAHGPGHLCVGTARFRLLKPLLLWNAFEQMSTLALSKQRTGDTGTYFR